MITVFADAPEGNKELEERVYRATHGNYISEPSENPRSSVPKQIRHRFLTTFVDFLMLFSPKTMLSDAPRRTVST